MTIADQLTLLSNTKSAIKTAIEAKGVPVGGIPFNQYPAKISEISGGSGGGEWARPSDWLSLPEITATSNKFVGLHAIYPDANFVALSASDAYTVDWGDGTVENFESGAIAQHEYNYTTYDEASTTLCSRGYKQAIVTVTPQVGQTISSLNLGRRHSALSVVHASGFLDIALGFNGLTSITIGSISPLVRFSILEKALITSAFGSSAEALFSNCYSLQAVELNNTSAVTNMASMFSSCSSLQSVPLFNTAAVTNMSGMFSNCFSLQSVPLFNTAAVTNMTNMFGGCRSLQSVPLFNTAAVTNMSGMFSNCSSLQSVTLFNTAAVTNMANMFSNCFSLQSVPLFNTAAVTNMANMFIGCSSLSRVEATGMKVSFSVVNCKLSAERLNEIYTNLATVTGQTITVTGNYGTASDDPSIATAKGWTVTE